MIAIQFILDHRELRVTVSMDFFVFTLLDSGCCHLQTEEHKKADMRSEITEESNTKSDLSQVVVACTNE